VGLRNQERSRPCHVHTDLAVVGWIEGGNLDLAIVDQCPLDAVALAGG